MCTVHYTHHAHLTPFGHTYIHYAPIQASWICSLKSRSGIFNAKLCFVIILQLYCVILCDIVIILYNTRPYSSHTAHIVFLIRFCCCRCCCCYSLVCFLLLLFVIVAAVVCLFVIVAVAFICTCTYNISKHGVYTQRNAVRAEMLTSLWGHMTDVNTKPT